MSIELKYSIIIPTYNRSKTLDLTLDSVCSQTISLQKYEIVVVDDGSTDNTKEVFLNFQRKYPDNNIRYFYEQNGGPAKARNLGIKESKGEIIFFTDDDCVVPQNWMETLLDGYRRHPDVVGVGGSYYKSSNGIFGSGYFNEYANKFVGFIDKHRNDHLFELENKSNIFGYSLAGNTANMSYKKEILEEVSGFDENLYFAGAVDWELKKNIQIRGYYLLYIPLMINHLKIFNFIHFFKRSFNQGRGRYYMFLKYPDLPFYDFSFFSFLKKIICYEYNDIKFFPAYFISILAFLGGRCYAKYIKPFKSIKSIEEFKKTNTEIFSVEKKNVKSNTVTSTNFFKFDKNRILNTKINYDSEFFSIVIPTYNRSRVLIKALNHLVGQTLLPEKYEIIVIDDGSTDNTKEVFLNFQRKYPDNNIRYFYEQNGGPAKARNLGIKESKGEIIFFTDDDCVVPQNWMETLLDGYRRHPDVVGVGGWHMPPEGELEKSAVSRYIYYLDFYQNFLNKSLRFFEVLTNDPVMFFGTFAYNTANVCYKKEILEKVNGFREDFYWPGSEDLELAFRIASNGHSLFYLPFHVIHPKDMSFLEFIKLYFRRGANGKILSVMHGELLEKLKPGFTKNYGSIASLISHLNGPEKFLAFLEWLSINAGIMYMKNKLSKRDNPILPEPKEEVGNN